MGSNAEQALLHRDHELVGFARGKIICVGIECRSNGFENTSQDKSQTPFRINTHAFQLSMGSSFLNALRKFVLGPLAQFRSGFILQRFDADKAICKLFCALSPREVFKFLMFYSFWQIHLYGLLLE